MPVSSWRESTALHFCCRARGLSPNRRQPCRTGTKQRSSPEATSVAKRPCALADLVDGEAVFAQHDVALGLPKRVEELPARHRDAAHRQTLRTQTLGSSDDQAYFRTAGDKDQVGFPALGIGEYICPAAQAVGGR